MGLPDITEERKVIDDYLAAECLLRTAQRRVDEMKPRSEKAMDALREKYKEAGVGPDECDHPFALIHSHDSSNRCVYCDKVLEYLG